MDIAGVEVCLDADTSNAPYCPHGPTLLFERFSQGHLNGKKFYACSACRDRHDCSFFQWEDEKVSEARRAAREQYNKSCQPRFTHTQHYQRYHDFLQLEEEQQKFCQSCSLLLLPDDENEHHGHKVIGVNAPQLTKPSYILPPLENKKKNAQYLFSEKAVQFLLKTVRDLGYTNILCVGAPRVHEAAHQTSDLTSFLMDIDHRYEQFYNPADFCRYNMFNHHFFSNSEAEQRYKDFIHQDQLILITDPPFGGLVEVLAHTVMRIMKDHKDHSHKDQDQLPVMWIFPYFMEPRILQWLPDFKMLDYKVDYDNHPLYHSGTKAKKQGSPVRIFTNIAPDRVVLPADEGYRFCSECNRYVSKENEHCDMCNSCPSKDGRTYRHCFKCDRCVKPARIHCDTCGQCVQADHKCGQTTSTGCHICGDPSHKRRNCPNKGNPSTKINRKRKQTEDSGNPLRAGAPQNKQKTQKNMNKKFKKTKRKKRH